MKTIEEIQAAVIELDRLQEEKYAANNALKVFIGKHTNRASHNVPDNVDEIEKVKRLFADFALKIISKKD